jgi:phage/plasmid-like protein (TIGR03299 family)
MAHQITIRENNFAEMAYVGDVAWHGLGQRLEENATIEQWQVAAGMDWKINQSPVQFTTDDMMHIGLMDDKRVLYRSDTKAALGIVSNRYQVVQPHDVLEFFRDLVAGNDFKLHTAGTLFGGARMWALASIGESANIVGRDEVGGYLLLSTSADGTLATEARFTTVRVVCNNTLSMALKAKDNNIVRLSHKTKFDGQGMKDKLGIATGQFAQFIGAAKALSNVTMQDNKAKEFLQSLLFKPEIIEIEDQSTQVKNKISDILSLYQGRGMGSDMPGVRGTAWGLVNAVTEWEDHHNKARTADAKLDSAFFGKGDEIKSAAMFKALELV